MNEWQILEGDCRDRLRELDAGSVQTVITSPPYFGLRDYGTGEWEGGEDGCDHLDDALSSQRTRTAARNFGTARGRTDDFLDRGASQFRDVCGKCGARRIDRQIGLEPTPDAFVAALVEVFREVRRVLRDDGTVWLNLGDSYAAARSYQVADSKHQAHDFGASNASVVPPGCKAKDLLLMPAQVALALRADGWWLRSEIVWSKYNPMPESVTDRPTSAHEKLFLLAKRPRYFYDADAIREEAQYGRREWSNVEANLAAATTGNDRRENHGIRATATVSGGDPSAGRNRRNVWEIATQPFPGAHFATFPAKLVEPCILAGSSVKACGECGAPWRRVVERTGYDNGDGSPGERGLGDARALSAVETGRADGFTKPPRNAAHNGHTTGWEPSCDHHDDTGRSVILDPFAGSGTVGLVALRHDRSFIGIELSPEYAEMARNRIRDDAPLLNTPAEIAAA